MITPITFPSALAFWLTCDDKTRQTAKNAINKPLSKINDPGRESLIDFAAQNNLIFPLHVLVPQKSMRHRGKALICHVLPKGIPQESFQTIQNIPIICPELCFLLAAEHLSVPDLALLATDLCGTYAINEQAPYGQIDRHPITSVQSIINYLQHVHQVNGITNAKSAIRFAMDKSHSPMESKLAVTAFLALRFGGFSAGRPKLNAIVHLSSSGQKHFGTESCCVDLLWEKQRVVVEYDSDLVHSSAVQIRKDKRKANALKMSGYSVINVTKDYFRNYSEAENLFFMIRNLLGIRNRIQSFSASKEKRIELIKHFFLSYDSQSWLDWARSQSGMRKLTKDS